MIPKRNTKINGWIFKKVQERLGDALMYKYETYSKKGHVPYPAF
jgi:hypothetical protein